MAEMGLGYGSEYQLLRYLGHHRIELNNVINSNTRLSGEIQWLDFPKDTTRLSLDGEYITIDFLHDKISEEAFAALKSKWKNYWSPSGTQPNWDGVFLHRKDNEEEWIIVEAKAHLGEIKSSTKAALNPNIQNAFIETQNRFGIKNEHWFGEYYQLANRLAFINFLLENNINASLLYIYFINGYEKQQLKKRKTILVESKSVNKQIDWEKAIEQEYIDLGINEKAKKYISNIFIDCK